MSNEDIIIWILIWPAASVLGLLLTAWIFAQVFQVKKKLEMQKVQIKLLFKMAEQAGINKVELKEIVGDVIAVY